MISIKDISFAYGKKSVLQNFSLDIAEKSIICITGRNGSGKSSLLALIAGDLHSNSGQIEIDGRDVTQYSLKELANIRSFAQQSHQYWMAYTAREVLLLGNEAVSAERFEEIIAGLSISTFINQPVTNLSGGQLQRIEIARALLRPTRWVLLDEPFASQDLHSQSVIIDFIKSERGRGRAFVVVVHERDSDLTWCDQVIEITTPE